VESLLLDPDAKSCCKSCGKSCQATSIAWNPSYQEGLLGRLLGDRKSVVRAGANLIFDQSVIYATTNFEDQSNYVFGDTFAQEFNQGKSSFHGLLFQS